MLHYTILRLLFACFLLYFAWPYIPEATTQIAKIFWASWLVFLLLVIGGNLSTLLRMTLPPIMEQKPVVQQKPEMKQRDRGF